MDFATKFEIDQVNQWKVAKLAKLKAIIDMQRHKAEINERTIGKDVSSKICYNWMNLIILSMLKWFNSEKI